ncbi:DUF3159 domain-containing protein [Nocardioides sp. CN2-186]|uniref:DUF3159 domain-containing protein n=1 Tax=Nocardioides tweenelious TaxID=3156607 RepID=UPI0032B35DF9
MSTPSPDLPTTPTRREMLHLSIDGAGPIIAFVIGNQVSGVTAGAVAAVALAVVIAAIRWVRGEPKKVVVGATLLVCLLALTATLTGEGRNFFLPELVFNIVMLVVFVVSVVIGRPATAVVCSAIHLEEPRSWTIPDRRRVHYRLTWVWIAMWVLHVVVVGVFYLADSVVWLGVVSTVINKPTIVAAAVATGIVARRRKPDQSLASHPV